MLSDKLLLGNNGLFIQGEVIRLVGVGVTKLDDGSYRQLSLFDNTFNAPSKDDQKQKKLDEMSKLIDEKYGKNTIFKGSSL